MLWVGERAFPGRPIALAVVILAIAAASVFGLPALGVPITGQIPQGLPSLAVPALRLRDVDGIFPLAAGCLLLAYIEGVSAARSFATKHGYVLDPRQEFLGLGAANLFAALGHGYPVAGGLSQSAVNEKAGARTPLALVFASLTLALSLLFLTGFLDDLPKAVLAAIVFTAVLGLVDARTLSRMWRISKPDFYAAVIALAAVLLLGILQGILLAAAASVLILLARASQPHVAFLGRIPGTSSYSDLARHPENEQLPHVIVFRPEASLLYVNAEFVSQTVLERLTSIGKASIRTVVCDLSASPYIDLAGSRMLRLLYTELAASGVALRILGARGRVRDLLRADGLGDIVSDRGTKLETVVDSSV
jgi:MFS superfamily sulfate permease-like transporter